MLNGKIFRISFFMLLLAFCLHLSLPVIADNGCDDGIYISTSPGNADYGIMHPPLKFDPNNPEEITCGPENAITIAIIGGCPPFTWEVSGTGYTLWETSGVSNTLTCSGST